MKIVISNYVNTKIDRNLVRRVVLMADNFRRKDTDAIEFFGGNLLGVYPVKWLDADSTQWVEEILGIDDIIGLEREFGEIPEVNPSFAVSGNALNHSFLWLVHQGLSNPKLSKKDGALLATNAMDLLQYKFFTSLHTRRFPHRANKAVALAVYESLDRKTGLKRLGTWRGLFDDRTENVLGSTSIHYNTLRKWDDDQDNIEMINDIQSRLRSMINIMRDAMSTVMEEDSKISSGNVFTVVDGEKIIKDSVSEYSTIKQSLDGVVASHNDFIKPDVFKTITTIVSTVNPRVLKETLVYITDNYNTSVEGPVLQELVHDIVFSTFEFLRINNISVKELSLSIIRLRNIYRASRTINPDILSIRNRMTNVITDATGTRNKGVVASTKLAVILYIILRVLTL